MKNELSQRILVWIIVVVFVLACERLLAWTYVTDYSAFLAYCGLLVAFLVFVLYKSIVRLRPTHSAEMYLFGTHVGTFTNGFLYKTLTDKKGSSPGSLTQQEKYMKLGIRRGILGTDLVGGLWPFYIIYKFPTTDNQVFLHANKVFTKDDQEGEERSYRVSLTADPTFFVWFLTLRHFIAVVDTGTESLVDLTTTCPINEKDEQHKYEASLLSKILMSAMETLFLEALRKAASHFVWNGMSANDINVAKQYLEMGTLYELGEGGSILQRARIVRRPKAADGTEMDFDECMAAFKARTINLADFYGEDVMAVDINIEGIDIAKAGKDAPEDERAINTPFIGKQMGQRTAEEGKGRAAAIAAIQAKTGTADPDLILILEELKGAPISFNPIGGDVKSILTSLFGKK